MRQLRKRWLVVGLGVVSAPIVMASLAYACTSLATLNLSPTSGVAGTNVTVTGRGFAQHDPSDARTGQPVYIRFDSQRNPVLATVVPGQGLQADGSFSVQVTVPADAAPGNHVVIATQNRANGTPAGGTPARQAFTVLAPPRAAPQPNVPAAPQPQAAPAPLPAPQAVGGAPAGVGSAGAVAGQAGSGSQSQTAGGITSSQGGTAGGAGAAAGTAAAPAAAPAPFGAPAAAPVGRRSMTTPAEGPSTLLAVLLVAAGLLLTLGGTALVLAGRQGRTALAVIRRPRG